MLICDSVLDVLGHDLVRALLVGFDPGASFLGHRHLIHELLPAYLGVEASLSRFAVPLDVAALWAVPVVVAKLAEVRDVDPQLP